MTPEDINKVIGKEYDLENYNCWHLVMELVPNVPSIEVIGKRFSSAREFKREEHYQYFTEVTIPEDGDVVVLGRSPTEMYHAGVWYKGGVIHAERPSVVYKPLESLKVLYSEVRYYRAKS